MNKTNDAVKNVTGAATVAAEAKSAASQAAATKSADALFIGLAGNPNCGKTTLFNELTGSNGYVGNWPGVTVEKNQAPYKRNKKVTFVDLPGIYSLSPYSPEEVVSRDYIIDEQPHAIINLVDATNLERSLYLSTQVLETGCAVVIGLNMTDLLKERGDVIDTVELSKRLGAPVVQISALRGTNISELVDEACTAAKNTAVQPATKCFSPEVEDALTHIADIIRDTCDAEHVRWYAIKVFERDAQAIERLHLSDDILSACETYIAALEAQRDDDAESIITSDRYNWIEGVIAACVKKAEPKLTLSQKIDRIVTNRFLGLPIFAAVMFLVYYLSISTIGKQATDWVNDNLFGDGFFISQVGEESFNDDKEEFDDNHYQDKIDGFIDEAAKEGIETDGVADAINTLKENEDDEDAAQTLDDFVDAAKEINLVAHDVPIHNEDGNVIDTNDEVITTLDADGEPVLEDGQELQTIDAVDTDSFVEAQEALADEPDPADYEGFIPSIPTIATNALKSLGASDAVISLICDGIIAGVGSVLGFIPQMAVLFVLLCFLEDCGYMSRVAFVMDRVFRRFGLSGKSFIPMLISSGCGVPGVMATKTIENEKDRRMTAMLTTMIPCGAKQPIIALVMGVLIGGGDAWWVGPLFYFLSIVCILSSAIMLKKTKWFSGEPAPFVMELPDYHIPRLRSWALHVWERIGSYVGKAGTIIFAAAVGIWFLSNFGVAAWEGGAGTFGYLPSMDQVPDEFMDFSILAGIGNAIGWIFAPLGCANWQSAVASISALIAKENLVSTFGVLYGLGDATENSVSMWSGFAGMFTDGAGIIHVGALCAFVAFNMLDAPCFAAIGTIRKQMNDPKWFWFAIGYQCTFAWIVGLIMNQVWELVVFGTFGVWTVVAFALIAALLFQIFRPAPKWKNTNEKILDTLQELEDTASEE